MSPHLLLCGKWLKCHQRDPPIHALSHACGTDMYISKPTCCIHKKRKIHHYFHCTYTMPSTESFSFIEWRHFFHWATDECTYTLESQTQSLDFWNSGFIHTVGETDILHSPSVLCSEPHGGQNAAHFLSLFPHQVLLLCCWVWTHTIFY